MTRICYHRKRCKLADVAELVDAPDLGSGVFGREGSSPFIRIASASLVLKTLIVMSQERKTENYLIFTRQ